MAIDKNEQVSKGLKSPRKTRSIPGNVADWGSVDKAALVGLIAAVAHKGGAIRLGYTRDGGAYAVAFYWGGEYWNEYISPSQDVDHQVAVWREDWEAADPVQNDPKKPRK